MEREGCGNHQWLDEPYIGNSMINQNFFLNNWNIKCLCSDMFEVDKNRFFLQYFWYLNRFLKWWFRTSDALFLLCISMTKLLKTSDRRNMPTTFVTSGILNSDVCFRPICYSIVMYCLWLLHAYLSLLIFRHTDTHVCHINGHLRRGKDIPSKPMCKPGRLSTPTWTEFKLSVRIYVFI